MIISYMLITVYNCLDYIVYGLPLACLDVCVCLVV